MKKIFFSLLAIAALASCAKTEPVFTEADSEIMIAPVTAVSTKAVTGVIDGTVYPKAENFKVYAYWANEPAASTFETYGALYLNNVEFTNKGEYWGGTTPYYWPKNGSLRFAAYSPSSVPMVHTLADGVDEYTLNGFAYPTNVDDTYEVLVAKTSESYTAQTAAKNVSVVFEHALSWLQFYLKAATPAANNAFQVKNITINDVNNYGNMTADMNAGTKTWSTAYQTPAAPQFMVYNHASGATFAHDAKLFENGGTDQKAGNGVIVLPQPTTTVTITFDQLSINGTPALLNQTVTIPLTLDENKPWEAGKKYIYTVTFDLDEILINPSVEEWEVVEVPEIDATATEVANQEELKAALAAGRNVRLIDNINLTAPIEVGNSVVAKAGPVDVVLDLNGKTITAPSSDAIVVDEGATLTINGDGEVLAATDENSSANAVWVKYGNVTINGGYYYVGADGTSRNDCIYIGAAAYVGDAATKVSTVTINGGKFESKVQEQGQYWVLNKRDEFNSSKFVVKGGSFVAFDPANNKSESPAENFVAEGYASYELEPGVWTVAAKTDEIVVKSEAALRDAAEQGGNVVLAADITLDATINVAGKLTLDLNGKTVTNKVDNTTTDVFVVEETGDLTVNGNGSVAAVTGNDGYAVISKGKLTINGGAFTSGLDKDGYQNAVIYARHQNAVITINGGSFRCDDADENLAANRRDYRYTINKWGNAQDSTIEIKGGKFYKFNPGENLAENPTQTFLAKGYKVVADGDWFTVMAE